MPVCSIISLPTVVFGSWNAGRQCMNFVRGLPVALSRFGFFSIVQNSNEEIIASVKALS
jgi:hypothetical protein